MIEREISIDELLKRIKKKKNIAVIFTAIIFGCVFLSNYYMVSNINELSFYTKEIDINIEMAKTTQLMETAEEVIKSKSFAEAVHANNGLTLDEDFLDHIVYGQTSSADTNASIYIVKLLVSSKNLEEIEKFEEAIIEAGRPLLEIQFDSKITFESNEAERIVAGSDANLNLASPYNMYLERHSPSMHNLLIWFSMSVVIGFSIEILVILFKRTEP